MKATDYRKGMIERFWSYQKQHFPAWQDYFERKKGSDGRPPVFLKEAADLNVLMELGVSDVRGKVLLNEISRSDRHRWFRSMSSSQALAQSVFGNLKLYDRLDLLSDLTDESGEPLFGKVVLNPASFKLEYAVDYLGEPRRTSLDALIDGNYRVAVECKLTEQEVGQCSRPKLKENGPNYEQCCNGTYSIQKGRKSRCSLTEIGVKYWDYIPRVFKWRDNIDLDPCPVCKNYQLIRNVLSICVSRDFTLSLDNGHVVLIYDERNPAFNLGGYGFKAYEQTREALIEPRLLKRCSWQQIASRIRSVGGLSWLAEGLEKKYGI